MNCCCWADLHLISNGKLGVGWLSKHCAMMEVFHGGGVLEAVCGLMYQGLDILELDICLLFPPEKIGKALQGVLESIGAGLGLGAAGIGLPFASKTAMVVGEKRGVGM